MSRSRMSVLESAKKELGREVESLKEALSEREDMVQW